MNQPKRGSRRAQGLFYVSVTCRVVCVDALYAQAAVRTVSGWQKGTISSLSAFSSLTLSSMTMNMRERNERSRGSSSPSMAEGQLQKELNILRKKNQRPSHLSKKPFLPFCLCAGVCGSDHSLQALSSFISHTSRRLRTCNCVFRNV